MQKMLRRSASLLFILTLAAAIVIPTVAEPVSDAMGDQSSSGTAEDVPLADDYELSADLDVAGEPDGEDLVKVIVKVDAPSLLDYANEKGITVQEAMLRSARREVAQLAVMAAAKVAQQELDARTDRAVAEQFLSEASEQKRLSLSSAARRRSMIWKRRGAPARGRFWTGCWGRRPCGRP